ncbi:MAG: OmpH family outer membrane protein [Planctomycetota bacterium]|nr:OmpH family outer membrane protein [Planctomycetota bacterium]
MAFSFRKNLVLLSLAFVPILLFQFVSGARADNCARIAVVDIASVFNEHGRTDILEREIRRSQELYRGERDGLLKRIMTLKDEQSEYGRETLLWLMADQEISILKEEIKIRVKAADKDISKQAIAATELLLTEIEDLIIKYCKQKGISICFKVDKSPLRGAEMSKMELALKSVLYSDKTVDITADIIDILKKK